MESWWSSHCVFNGRNQSLVQRGVSSDGGLYCLRRGRTEKAWLVCDRSLAHSSSQWAPHHTHPLPVQELLMNLFSRQPCYLGLWFRVRECTQWELKPDHLLHSSTPLLNSQPSLFTKHQFLGTLSHRYLPFGTVGVCLTRGGGSVCVCVLYMCACATVHLSIPSKA